MGQTPITQAQWRVVAGWQPRDGESWGRELKLNPSYFQDGYKRKSENFALFFGEVNTHRRPVEQVNWDDAIEFCERLSKRTGRNYSLPSEDQWEYACRAGSTTPFHFGETISPELANYNGDYTYGHGLKSKYLKQTSPVGIFPANAWGLHDMHGNAWEWCLDKSHSNHEGALKDGRARLDPDFKQAVVNIDSRFVRGLLRGGCWSNRPEDCRSAYCFHPKPAFVGLSVGLRLVCLPQGCSSTAARKPIG
jgi:formylglycine-generating enzyme required for sulfatase activity